MTPVLQDYANRFNLNLNRQVFSSFFTQLDPSKFARELPYLFDIDSFCLRLLEALVCGHKICIYSDFDTDATTATGVMYWGLLDLGFAKENLSFYVPDRFTEGYGLNPQSISQLANTCDLIITVDCGINSTLEADICQNKRADLIITDHHHLTAELPNCVAVCNPRLAEYYSNNQTSIKNPQIPPNLRNKLSPDKLNYLKQFMSDISTRQRQLVTNYQSHNSLSPSVTGVGTAWFCLVWLGYFLDGAVEVIEDKYS